MNLSVNHLLGGLGVLLLLNLNQRGRDQAENAATAADDLAGTGGGSSSTKSGGLLDQILAPIIGNPAANPSGGAAGGTKSQSARKWLDTYTKPQRSDAAKLAQRLHVAMDGWGCDEDEVVSVAYEMKAKGLPFKLVAWYYEAAYPKEGTLMKRIEDEMWGDQLTEFMQIIPTK